MYATLSPAGLEEALLEAISTVLGAHEVFEALEGGTETHLGVSFGNAGHRLLEAAFGPLAPEDDEDGWVRHPAVVETESRSHEIAADFLESLGIDDQVARLRRVARRYREQGTLDVDHG